MRESEGSRYAKREHSLTVDEFQQLFINLRDFCFLRALLLVVALHFLPLPVFFFSLWASGSLKDHLLHSAPPAGSVTMNGTKQKQREST